MVSISLSSLLTVLILASAARGMTAGAVPGMVDAPDEGSVHSASPTSRSSFDSGVTDTCRGWPVDLGTPGAGFPYTPTLFDVDGDGASEIFLTGGETFGLDGGGGFLPGWPTSEMLYMGYGTNAQLPGPSCADLEGDGDVEILWSERDWYAGSSYMWSFNGRETGGSNMPGFPQSAPDQSSNALNSPFVLGDSDGDGDLEAWSAHTLGNTGEYYRISGFDHQGDRLFTTDLDPEEQILDLYFGDLDGNGSDEFFAVTTLGTAWRLHAFTPEGDEQAGYPVQLFDPGAGYPIFGPPVPADLDGDGDLEVVLGYNLSGTSTVQARHHDGSGVGGFPITIASGSQLFYVGTGDVTGDGIPELVAFENELAADYRVWVLDIETGAVLSGWPCTVPDWPKGFPTIVDISGNGVQDICFATDGGELYAYSAEGTVLDGYPKVMSAPSVSGVAAGDIDGDGLYELVAATWDGMVYAWDTGGVLGPHTADWPMRGVDARNTGVFRGSGTSGLETGIPSPDGLTVAGNPARGTVTFMASCAAGAELEVFDLTGRMVHSAGMPGSGTLVWHPDVAAPAGIYLAMLRRSGEELGSVRVVLLR